MNLLVALNALLEEKHVTRAAERLYMSQPAMSAALQRLRETFNDQLLIRVGRNMELTPRAESLINPVRDVLMQVHNTIESDISFDPTKARRSFTIAMSDFIYSIFMPRVIQQVINNNPGIKFKIINIDSKTHKDIEAGTVDLMIRADMDTLEAKLITENLHTGPLISDEWVCVADINHPTVKDNISLEEYLLLPHVSLFLGEGTVTVESVNMLQMSMDLDVKLMVPNFTNLLLSLPGTDLVTLLPNRMAKLLTQNMPAKILKPPFELAPLKELMVWHKRSDNDPAHVWLRSLFLELSKNL